MNSKLTKFAQAAALGLALTFTACEEKKKQDSTATATEPEAAAETQQPTQEAAAPPPTQETAEVVKGSFTDTRDDKTYKTVKIGTQTWMAENLNYETGNSVCYFADPANCQKYGRLYDWKTAKKACPSGWHLPSNAEWQTLVDFAGGDKVAGKKLKAKSGWNNNGSGTDNYGFAALPGGKGEDYNNNFEYVGSLGYWWSATESDADVVKCWIMIHDHESIDRFDLNKESEPVSVRCIKD